jgi:hypothetical protein
MKPIKYAAVAAWLALSGCAVYPSEPAAYAPGYYPYPAYDGLYGSTGFALGGWGPYPYGFIRRHPWDHRSHFANHGFGHPHIGRFGGFHGHGGMGHGGMGHGGMGHGGMGHVGMMGHPGAPHS